MNFVDTNVLIYAVCPGPGDMAKQELAANALERADVGLSSQVLQEFYWQVTHPQRPEALSRQDAGHLVEAFTRFQVAPITKELVRAAIATCMRFQIAYWDGAIIEAAKELGCDTILSEDLNDGQDYGGVRVENPFRGC